MFVSVKAMFIHVHRFNNLSPSRPEKGKAPKIDFNQFNGSQSSAEVRLEQYSVIN